jgi:hypothetical protein
MAPEAIGRFLVLSGYRSEFLNTLFIDHTYQLDDQIHDQGYRSIYIQRLQLAQLIVRLSESVVIIDATDLRVGQ